MSQKSPDHGRSEAPPTVDVQALIVAFEDVLIDATAWRRWLLQLLRRLGIHTNYSSLFRVWECDFEPEIRSGRHPRSYVFRRFLRALGLTAPQAQEVELAARCKRRKLLDDPRPLPGVLAALHQLRRRRVKMSVVRFQAEWEDEFEGMLARAKLNSYFDHAVCWNDGDDWTTVVNPWRMPTPQVGFVSSRSWQIVGAGKSGLTTIGVGPADPTAAHHCIDHLEQLPKLLKSVA